MNKNEVMTELLEIFKQNSIEVNCIQIDGGNEDNRTIEKITISLGDYWDDDALTNLKYSFDLFEDKFDITVLTKLIEI